MNLRFLKKLSIAAIATLFAATGCGESGPSSKEIVQDTKGIINKVAAISDASAENTFIADFKLPAKVNDVEITWESSNTAIKIGEEVDDLYTANVVRPTNGVDATGKVTGTLKFKNKGKDVTEKYEINTVVPDIVISSVTQIRAMTRLTGLSAILTVIDYASDGFIGIDSEGKALFVYTSSPKVTIGKVYEVSGALDIYYGLYQVSNPSGSGVAQVTYREIAATPTAAPFPTTVKPVTDFLVATLPWNNNTSEYCDNYGIQAIVTGKVTKIGNEYYIENPENSTQRIQLYRNSEGYRAIENFETTYVGKIVEVKIVTYTFRTDVSAWRCYIAQQPNNIKVIG